MAINYDEIIERANQRKDALKHFAELMAKMPEQMGTFCAFMAYLDELKQAADNLDHEAQNLLGSREINVLKETIREFNKVPEFMGSLYYGERPHEVLNKLYEAVK